MTGRRALAAVAATFALLSVACAGGGADYDPVSRAELQRTMRSRGVEAPEIVIPYRLTPEMRAWADEKVPDTAVDIDMKLHHLTEALFDPDEFDLVYEKTHTGTAEEVFQTRRANCLAFTHLFIGMAREMGVGAFFVEVRDVESYERAGDLIVVSDHVAVGYGPHHDVKIIDFAVSPEEVRYRRIRKITDERAIAMYYSNRGAEFLRRGDYAAAQNWLRAAVAIDPGYAASWVNYGVAMRRNGNLEGAEAAYRTALEMDLQASSAIQNLAAILSAKGEDEEALALLELADRGHNRNPYTYLTLGDLSMRHGNVDEAGRFYRKAARRRADSAEPLAALGLWELRQGQHRRARRLLERAQEIDPESQRVAQLQSSLSSEGS